MSRTCSECPKPLFARGLCSMHYSRLQRHGNTAPDGLRSWERRPALDDPVAWLDWLLRNSLVDVAGCWVWQRSVYGGGYANTSSAHGTTPHAYGHRLSAWAASYAETGAPPDLTGLQVDHQCHILGKAPAPERRCVNPAHLVVRTGPENRDEQHYRNAKAREVLALVAALREVAPAHPLLERYPCS